MANTPKTFNARELLEIAVQIEVNGSAYYARMAELAQSPKVKEVFTQLAKAERQHIIDFQAIRDRLGDEEFEIPQEYQSPEITMYLNAFSDGRIFPNWGAAEEVVKEITSDLEALGHAVNFEKDSIIFFHEIYDILPPDHPDRQAVGELIRQEKVHISRLFTIISSLRQS